MLRYRSLVCSPYSVTCVANEPPSLVPPEILEPPGEPSHCGCTVRRTHLANSRWAYLGDHARCCRASSTAAARPGSPRTFRRCMRVRRSHVEEFVRLQAADLKNLRTGSRSESQDRGRQVDRGGCRDVASETICRVLLLQRSLALLWQWRRSRAISMDHPL
jgi:hypothetical protein